MSEAARVNEAVTLLIVDDNPLYRSLATMGLKELEGFAVTPVFADSMADAVAQFEREKPDVTLLDINLPGSGDGLDLLDHFLTANPKAYVVMMTSHSEAECVKRAKDAGAQGYVLKPFNSKTLQDAFLKYRTFKLAGKQSSRAAGYVPSKAALKQEAPKSGEARLADVMASWTVLHVGETLAPLEQIFGQAKCRVKSFANGHAAWNFLENNHVDMLIVDARLPDFDGMHLANQVRLMDAEKPIKTLMVAVYDSTEEVNEQRLRLVGVPYYWVKPLDGTQVAGFFQAYAVHYLALMNARMVR